MKTRSDSLDFQELDDLILKVLGRNRFGLTAAKIRPNLPPAYRTSPKHLVARIEDLLSKGRIHAWRPPDKGAGKPATTIFSLEPLEPLVSDTILESLKLQALSPAEIKRQFPPHIASQFQVFLDPLLSNGTVKRHPPLKGKRLLSPLDPDPGVYLAGELRRLFEKGTKLGFSMEAIRLSPQRYLTDQQPNKETVHAPAEIESIIFKAMTSLKPAAARGALVYIPDLRGALREVFRDKDSFDRAILHLAEQEKVQLQSHSLPAELTPEEKGCMIDNGRGSYFMAIGIRME